MPSPTHILPGADLSQRTDDATLARLGGELRDYIRDLERQNAPYFRQIAHWWDWYEAKPKSPQKDFPFRGASNIVVPIIQLMSDTLQARSLASIFGAGDRVWETTTENEANRHLIPNVRRMLNWAAAGNDFDLFDTMYNVTGEFFPIGSTVAAINYRRDLRRVFFGSGRSPQIRTVEMKRGVSLEQVPRHLMMWDTRWSVMEAPVVTREHHYTWQQLKFFAAEAHAGRGAWIPSQIASMAGLGSDPRSGESGQVQRKLDELDFRAMEAGQPERSEFKVYEVHLDWPILRSMGVGLDPKLSIDQPEAPVVVHIEDRTERVLRITANPYHLLHKPFFDFYFRKRSGRGAGVGVSKKLEQIQLGLTAMVNQAIDSVTRSNTIWARTGDSKHLKEAISPGHPIYDPTKSFEALNVGTPIQQNIAMFTGLNTMGEKLIGVFDPLQGRETRSGGHPSPATSTLALLEQAQIAGTSTTKLVRKRLSQIGCAAAVLYQQFETNADGKLDRVFGAEDASDIKQMMFPQDPIPLNWTFDVAALSETLNPDTQMRRAVLVDQVGDVYWSRVLQGVQVLESPQVGPMVKLAWHDYIKAKTNTYRKVLQATNIDEVEEFLVQLRSATGPEQFTQATGGLREIAEGAGGLPPEGPVRGAANGSGAGSAAAFAGGGLAA